MRAFMLLRSAATACAAQPNQYDVSIGLSLSSAHIVQLLSQIAVRNALFLHPLGLLLGALARHIRKLLL